MFQLTNSLISSVTLLFVSNAGLCDSGGQEGPSLCKTEPHCWRRCNSLWLPISADQCQLYLMPLWMFISNACATRVKTLPSHPKTCSIVFERYQELKKKSPNWAERGHVTADEGQSFMATTLRHTTILYRRYARGVTIVMSQVFFS